MAPPPPKAQESVSPMMWSLVVDHNPGEALALKSIGAVQIGHYGGEEEAEEGAGGGGGREMEEREKWKDEEEK